MTDSGDGQVVWRAGDPVTMNAVDAVVRAYMRDIEDVQRDLAVQVNAALQTLADAINTAFAAQHEHVEQVRQVAVASFNGRSLKRVHRDDNGNMTHVEEFKL